jgi:hypothetical protein
MMLFLAGDNYLSIVQVNASVLQASLVLRRLWGGEVIATSRRLSCPLGEHLRNVT